MYLLTPKLEVSSLVSWKGVLGHHPIVSNLDNPPKATSHHIQVLVWGCWNASSGVALS